MLVYFLLVQHDYTSWYLAACFLGAYLLGSVPTAVWVGRLFYHIDVRDHGSGNAGATNTFRVLGRRAGIPVMIIDIFKGYLASSLAYMVPRLAASTSHFIIIQIILGIIAVGGHIYPVFAGFRGGKGIATLFGMVLSINALAGALCLVVFLIVLVITHYVSLSSMTAATSYPLIILLIFPSSPGSLVYFGIMVCLLVIYTHRKNITRLVEKTESKSYLFGKPTAKM